MEPDKTEYVKGSYVIIQHESQYFPGIVIDNVDKGIKVKRVIMIRQNFWKWPEKDDTLI